MRAVPTWGIEFICGALLGGVGPLVCDRADLHTTGHTFTAAWAPDPHDHTEATES